MSASERCRAAEALGRNQARKFLGRGRMVKSNFRHCEQRDVLLAVCRDKTVGIADVPTHCSACPGGSCPWWWADIAAPSSPAPGASGWSPIRGAWSASALSTILGSVFRAASCWGAGKHPEQGGEQKGDEGALHGRGCPELCVLECSRTAGSR